jgi:hypothetical protein
VYSTFQETCYGEIPRRDRTEELYEDFSWGLDEAVGLRIVGAITPGFLFSEPGCLDGPKATQKTHLNSERLDKGFSDKLVGANVSGSSSCPACSKCYVPNSFLIFAFAPPSISLQSESLSTLDFHLPIFFYDDVNSDFQCCYK